jgi:hypothetical protein
MEQIETKVHQKHILLVVYYNIFPGYRRQGVLGILGYIQLCVYPTVIFDFQVYVQSTPCQRIRFVATTFR